MVSDNFTMSVQKTKLLTQNDPAPVTINRGKSNLIFTFPHNALNVPENIAPCLGAEKEWFENAHEAHDLYMAETYDLMREKFPEATFIRGNYSRLVVDLNRHPDYAVRHNSSENKDIIIPHNTADICCALQKLKRMEEIYHPCHAQKKQIIEETRYKHDGVIVMDMHSFSPIWNGKPREVELGTIRARKTPLSNALEGFFKQHMDAYKYISGEPYKVADMPSNAAAYIANECDIQYLGIEIRNDLLKTQEDREKFTNFLKRGIDHILSLEKNEPDTLKQITARRSEILGTEPSKSNENIYDSWMI